MRALTVLAGLIAVAVAVGASGAATSGPTALHVVLFEDGYEPETRVSYTLRCDPVRGTHPRRTAACRELRRLGISTLLPVPPQKACTEIYGGPQIAYVIGVVDGRRVWAKLRRDNGCQIDRWERNWFLVPTGTVR